MRSVADHRAEVLTLLEPLAHRAPTRLSLQSVAGTPGLGRILAEDILSPIDHPPFDNSQMDGYAVRRADVVPGRQLPVADAIAAGQNIRVLEPGTAAPIMTGAPIPRAADSVIPIEQAVPNRFGSTGVVFADVPHAGSFVRARGSDLARGALLLSAGTPLTAARWGILAASGIPLIAVIPKVRVLVISTGDEVLDPSESLAPGRVFDANGVAMAMAVADAGGEVTAVVRVSDDATTLRALLAEHARGADVILTTGGVSAGAFEVVRDVFAPAGVSFVSVAMQPGGPQGLGMARLTDTDGVEIERPVVAFPGNPVSALVSFEMFLRPALRHLQGLPTLRPTLTVPLAEPLQSPPTKHQVRRGLLRPDGRVALVGGPSSHLLHSYATSTHLVHIPVGVSHLDSGDSVEVWSIE